MFINYKVISDTTLNSTPFLWHMDDNLITPEFRARLVNTFPKSGYSEYMADKNCRTYYAFNKPIELKHPHFGLDSGEVIWQKFLKELVSKKYITSLSKLCNIDLRSSKIEMNLWKYTKGNFLPPDTEYPNKVVTQLFYFNDNWEEDYGGLLEILSSSSHGDRYTNIAPANCRSVILVHSPYSWHATTQQHTGKECNVLQISFMAKGK